MGRKNDRDPFSEWREWQDHRYDPGYFLGGRVHPFYRSLSRGPRARPFGFVLLLSGAVFMGFGIAGLRRGDVGDVVQLVIGFLQILVGARVIAGRRRKGGRPESKVKGNDRVVPADRGASPK